MADKIEKLTPEQGAYLPIFRQKWLDIGWSSEPANKPLAEEALSGMYQCIDLESPAFIWVESPAQAQIMLNIFDNIPNMTEGLADFLSKKPTATELFSFFDKMGIDLELSKKMYSGLDLNFSVADVVQSTMTQLLNNIDESKFLREFHRRVTKTTDESVFDSIMESMTNNLVTNTIPYICSTIDESLGDMSRDTAAITACVASAVFKALKTLTFDYQSTLLYGQTDAYWVAFYKFCQHIGVEYKEDQLKKLDYWDSFVKSAGWAYPFTRVCIVCDRPESALRDDNDVLHGDDGYALKFRDGWEVYSSHGVGVDKWIITEPEKITIKDIDDQPNIEVKRIMQEQMGIGKYLDQSEAITIHMDAKSNDGRGIPRALMEDKDGRRFLCGTDKSTSRVYYMEVPKECETCSEAHTALAGFDESKIIAAS